MLKYNVSLKVRFEVEGESMAEAIKQVIQTLTNNFENVRSLELSNIWEFQEPGPDTVQSEVSDRK